MDAFTSALLQKGNLVEIECWHEIAHEACQFVWTGTPKHTYWFWSNLYWDTIEIVRAIRQPHDFELDTSQELNVPQLINNLEAVGFNVVVFE